MSSIKTRLHNAREKFLRRSSATSTTTRSLASSGRQRTRAPAQGPLNAAQEHQPLQAARGAQPGDGRLQRQAGQVGDPGRFDRSGRSAPPAFETFDINNSHTLCIRIERPAQPLHAAATHSLALVALGPTRLSSCHARGAHAHPPARGAGRPRPEPSPADPVAIVCGASCAASLSSPNADAKIIKTLLVPDTSTAPLQTGPPTATDYFGGAPAHFSTSMLHRKIWVKRPNASATLVQIREDDLVDDVRDMILKKYSNSLGRSFDAPDVTLRIVPRDTTRGNERTLGPEEDMCRTLDAYFPGGQLVTDALVIDVPQRRTPKPSPQVPVYYKHHDDHTNHQTEYFPPMPVVNPSPAALGADARLPLPHAHSIAVLNTGQLPPLPSPGGRTARGIHHSARPKYPRHNTASPTILAGGIPSSATSVRPPNRPRHDSSASETKHSTTSNNPIPTPPAPVDPNTRQPSNPPTPRVASPRPRKKGKNKQIMEPPSLPAGLLDGSVPPINVLIVEDNIINLRVLGAFMQRLKVRWQRAMNGKEAVTKWKAGGFHLVLMDIQLPVMNGLEATKEIRRLERVNSIGVFSSGSNEAPNNRLGEDGNGPEEPQKDDKLGDKGLFKSPVIIVALTASSLQSDRHEALAAGCNDFLTKPVNFVWLERKVKEWGCMQALIDFDGWRRWKDFADKSETMDSKSKMSASFSSIAPQKKKETTLSPTMAANPPDGSGMSLNGVKKEEEKEKKSKRRSTGIIPPPTLMEDNEAGTPDAAEGSGS
ncbi:hypothetical protein SNOG_09580 [Parastagonospora nodorum SN15]|uniref:Response regulatory domain-containing protein n=1 Tax=Phaeosphaeria nodorum (strain SN15 / ATCC MYA-4574 / FGSC 10173) TaxID=321614 RepID=Q0UF84_PHANO|nr:hypothetical protein SNOG_09580 [Parastagonospora nodorum SN15]EAT82845.1 hypothetical protein SNOG_09580 [Parastagonospora nodorum SN15]